MNECIWHPTIRLEELDDNSNECLECEEQNRQCPRFSNVKNYYKAKLAESIQRRRLQI